MKGDFSRDTFSRQKHYRRVLMQQGRVEVDADANEQIGIDAYIDQTTNLDVIGQSGVPCLADGTPAPAFQITLDTAKGEVGIGKGHMYVGGQLVENEADVTYLTQPDRPGLTLAGDPGLTGDGIYVAYLDVWERLITALDDPLIRETALGGPDHAVRSKVVWQVKLAKAAALGATITCADTGDGWKPLAGTGALAASTAVPQVDLLPCILPPETGYRRLENQLYRVEIHRPGPLGTATFKWSRENGSVVAGVVGDGGGGATVFGPAFHTTTTGRDDSLGFAPDDWVELSDDPSDLLNGAGQLLQVKTVDPASLIITTTAAATTSADPKQHARLRRWDQSGAGLENGVPIPDSSPIALEEGIQVAFAAGQYNVGDYWLIPARTQSQVSGGHAEWPVDAGGAALSLPPRGVAHAYAKLALIEVSGGAFQRINGEVPDCRLCFQPLTQLKPCQPCASPCTLVARPGVGWEKPILDLFAKTPGVDAEICFPVGKFPIAKSLQISGAGHVKVTGAGWGTRLVSETQESVIRFIQCDSVSVCDLTAVTSTVDTQPGPAAPGAGPFDRRDHINGALEFVDCGDVTLENLALTCGGGALRGASCVTVRSSVTEANAASGAGAVRIGGCHLNVGDMQTGILLVHQQSAWIEDNVIRAAPRLTKLTWTKALADRRFFALARRALLSNAAVVRDVTRPVPGRTVAATVVAPAVVEVAPATKPAVDVTAPRPVVQRAQQNVTVTIAGRAVAFQSHPELQTTWQAYFDSVAPKAFATDRDILAFVSTSAGNLLTDQAALKTFADFNTTLQRVRQLDAPVAAKAIAVGGRTIRDLHISGNQITGALQAITVGMSHQEILPLGPPDRAGRVEIVGNTIETTFSFLARGGARNAIFVGNVESLHIEQNRIALQANALAFVPRTEGVKVYGYLGKLLIIRHNHLNSFRTGIRVISLTGPGSVDTTKPAEYMGATQSGNLWLVADNMCAGTEQPIDAANCTLWGNWH